MIDPDRVRRGDRITADWANAVGDSIRANGRVSAGPGLAIRRGAGSLGVALVDGLRLRWFSAPNGVPARAGNAAGNAACKGYTSDPTDFGLDPAFDDVVWNCWPVAIPAAADLLAFQEGGYWRAVDWTCQVSTPAPPTNPGPTPPPTRPADPPPATPPGPTPPDPSPPIPTITLPPPSDPAPWQNPYLSGRSSPSPTPSPSGVGPIPTGGPPPP